MAPALRFMRWWTPIRPFRKALSSPRSLRSRLLAAEPLITTTRTFRWVRFRPSRSPPPTDPIPRFQQITPPADCTIVGDCSAHYFPALAVPETSLQYTAQAGGVTINELRASAEFRRWVIAVDRVGQLRQRQRLVGRVAHLGTKRRDYSNRRCSRELSRQGLIRQL